MTYRCRRYWRFYAIFKYYHEICQNSATLQAIVYLVHLFQWHHFFRRLGWLSSVLSKDYMDSPIVETSPPTNLLNSALHTACKKLNIFYYLLYNNIAANGFQSGCQLSVPCCVSRMIWHFPVKCIERIVNRPC